MNPEVALMPECCECGEVWLPADPARWQMHLDVDGELVWFCSTCADREFGRPRRRA